MREVYLTEVAELNIKSHLNHFIMNEFQDCIDNSKGTQKKYLEYSFIGIINFLFEYVPFS